LTLNLGKNTEIGSVEYTVKYEYALTNQRQGGAGHGFLGLEKKMLNVHIDCGNLSFRAAKERPVHSRPAAHDDGGGRRATVNPESGVERPGEHGPDRVQQGHGVAGDAVEGQDPRGVIQVHAHPGGRGGLAGDVLHHAAPVGAIQGPGRGVAVPVLLTSLYAAATDTAPPLLSTSQEWRPARLSLLRTRRLAGVPLVVLHVRGFPAEGGLALFQSRKTGEEL